MTTQPLPSSWADRFVFGTDHIDVTTWHDGDRWFTRIESTAPMGPNGARRMSRWYSTRDKAVAGHAEAVAAMRDWAKAAGFDVHEVGQS